MLSGMGFYATDTLESCPAAKPDPLKKSRLGFFSTSGSRAGFSALQPVETHRENEATSTKTVSGSFRHYEYSPFGESIVATGPLAKENPFRFSTKYWDDETGLGYWGYRYYSPSLGRWLSPDPASEISLYASKLFEANNNNILNSFSARQYLSPNEAIDNLVKNMSMLSDDIGGILAMAPNSGQANSLAGIIEMLKNIKRMADEIIIKANRIRYTSQNNARFDTLLQQSVGSQIAELNAYAYCLNNPINAVDNLGLLTWGEVWESIKEALKTALKNLAEGLTGCPVPLDTLDPAMTNLYGIANYVSGLRNDFLKDPHNAPVPDGGW